MKGKHLIITAIILAALTILMAWMSSDTKIFSENFTIPFYIISLPGVAMMFIIIVQGTLLDKNKKKETDVKPEEKPDEE